MTEKEYKKALIIRIRFLLAQENFYIKNTSQRYLYACEILNITEGTARNIMSKNKDVAKMTLQKAKKELKKIDIYMYKLAIM